MNQRRLFWVSVIVLFFAFGNHCWAQSITESEIRVSVNKIIESPFEVGDTVEIPLSLSYRKMPKGARIYVHLLPLADTSWIFFGGGKINVNSLTLNLAGTFVNKDNNIFSISPQNYPISMLIKQKEVAQLFMRFGANANSVDGVAKAICGGKEGFGFTLAFLAAVGEKSDGNSQVKLSFVVPSYQHYYNGILVTPFIMIYKDDGSQLVYTNSKNMNSFKVPVKPIRQKPADDEKVSYDDFSGNISLDSYIPSNVSLVPGAANTIKIQGSYSDLKPGTAIYVVMLPVDGNKVIAKNRTFSFSNIKGISKISIIDKKSPQLQIPTSNSPILIPVFGIEAALLHVAKTGGSGTLSKNITFTPPVFAAKYPFIHFLPVMVIPTDQGLRAMVDFGRLKGLKINTVDR